MSTSITSGARVRLLRKRLGLAQQKFADLLGVSRSYLGDIELSRCEPSVAFLTALTSQTDGSSDWILTGQGNMLRAERAGPPAAGVSEGDTLQDDRRIAALVAVLGALDAEARDAVIADCFARAATAKQLADLHQAVREIADDRVRKVS